MDFQLNDDRRMLAETLERFLADNYPIDKRHEFSASQGGYSQAMWKRFGELGVIAAMFGEEAGGFGGQGADLMVLFHALGKALVVEPFLPTLLGGSVLVQLAPDDARRHLEPILSGQGNLALAHGEPEARYSLSTVATVATRSQDNYTLSGRKTAVLGAGTASAIVVTARTSCESDDEQGISAFLVDRASEGLNVRSYTTVDGYGAAEIELDNVSARIVGEADNAYRAVEHAYARSIVAICAEAFGAMEVARDMTVEYMHTRKQFGVPIGKFQVLQHRMADVLIEIEQVQSALIAAAGNLDADRARSERFVSAAKNLVGRAGRLVAEEAIQIHGGMGMTWEYPVSHYAKRIIMIDHLFGDTDFHLQRFAHMQ